MAKPCLLNMNSLIFESTNPDLNTMESSSPLLIMLCDVHHHLLGWIVGGALRNRMGRDLTVPCIVCKHVGLCFPSVFCCPLSERIFHGIFHRRRRSWKQTLLFERYHPSSFLYFFKTPNLSAKREGPHLSGISCFSMLGNLGTWCSHPCSLHLGIQNDLKTNRFSYTLRSGMADSVSFLATLYDIIF
jgi:hypothetical protein